MSTADGTRRCPRCTESLPYALFYVRKTGKYAGRHYGWCKTCQSTYHKKRYATEPEYRGTSLAQSAAWVAANPEKHAPNVNKWKADNAARNRAVNLAHWHTKGKFKQQERRRNERIQTTG